MKRWLRAFSISIQRHVHCPSLVVMCADPGAPPENAGEAHLRLCCFLLFPIASVHCGAGVLAGTTVVRRPSGDLALAAWIGRWVLDGVDGQGLLPESDHRGHLCTP